MFIQRSLLLPTPSRTRCSHAEPIAGVERMSAELGRNNAFMQFIVAQRNQAYPERLRAAEPFQVVPCHHPNALAFLKSRPAKSKQHVALARRKHSDRLAVGQLQFAITRTRALHADFEAYVAIIHRFPHLARTRKKRARR